MLEQDPLFGQAVDHWRRFLLIAIATQVVVPRRVHADQQHVTDLPCGQRSLLTGSILIRELRVGLAAEGIHGDEHNSEADRSKQQSDLIAGNSRAARRQFDTGLGHEASSRCCCFVE